MKTLPQSKARRILLGLLVALLVAVSSTGWLAALFLNLETARAEVAAQLSRALRRHVEVGRLSVGFFRASLKDVTVTDRPGFGREPFITMSSLSASVQPLELLRGRLVLVISHIKAKRPIIYIKKSSSGEWNTEDLRDLMKGSKAEKSPPAARPSPSEASSEKQRHPHRLDIAGVKRVTLSNASLRYFDLSTGSVKRIPDLDLDCEGELGANPIQIARARIVLGALSVQVHGELTRDLKHGQITFQVSDFDLMAFKPHLPFLAGFERGRFIIRKTTLQGILQNEVLELRHISLEPSDGACEGNGKVWVREGKPGFGVDLRFSGVRLDPFLWQTRRDEISVAGTLEGTCSLSSMGNSFGELKAQLQGSAELHVSNGRFQNKVLLKIGDLAKQLFGLKNFDVYYATARGRFRLADEKIASSDLRFESALFDLFLTDEGYLTLDGDLRLPKVTLRGGSEKESIEVPLKIKGSLHKPKVDVEWKSLRKTLLGK